MEKITITFTLNATLKQLATAIGLLTKQSGDDTLEIVVKGAVFTVPSRKMKYDEGLINQVATLTNGYATIKVEAI